MAVIIFDNKLMDNSEWFNLEAIYDIVLPLTSFYLINDKIGAWYENIERQDIWRNRKFWTCKMWVVRIVLKLLLNLVAEKIISEKY
jgi:hypothetical protein